MFVLSTEICGNNAFPYTGDPDMADPSRGEANMAIAKNGLPISSLSEWSKRAGPKSKDHWREDRSAMEVARSWLAVTSPALPVEVAAVLASHSAFGVVNQWEAEPEARLSFDAFRGEPCNTDLIVYARDHFGDFVIAVEAKADEPFSETVAAALAAAVERKLGNPRSNGVARIEQLALALLGARRKGEPELGKLRYQLLTATAGALRAGEACGAKRVVLLVQEFWTRLTADAKHAANAVDLNRFVSRISHGIVSTVKPGVLHGPFKVHGTPLLSFSPLLFVGIAHIDLRSRSAKHDLQKWADSTLGRPGRNLTV